MTAVAALLTASLTTSFLHKLFFARDALAGHVADFLALVIAAEIQVACLSAVRIGLLTKNIR